MSKKSNPTLIGAFVVGATVLLALGVAVFGGAELFAKKRLQIAYFAEKTQGLRVGSNVAMNGVQIGQVSDMVLLINRDTFQSVTAVTMEIRPESWVVTKGRDAAHAPSVGDALRTLWKPPGWSADGSTHTARELQRQLA